MVGMLRVGASQGLTCGRPPVSARTARREDTCPPVTVVWASTGSTRRVAVTPVASTTTASTSTNSESQRGGGAVG